MFDISTEHKKKINAVINFIQQNPQEELSLAQLAGIANYSPFHFQKIFKQVTGESPKQFIIKVRMINVAHYLLTHTHKSITEIALDNGFASSSTFARSFRNFFGISAEELRNIPSKDHTTITKYLKHIKINGNFFVNDNNGREKDLSIEIKKAQSLKVIFVNAPLTDIGEIHKSFKRVIQFAEARDLLTVNTQFVGIVNPNAGIYQAGITLQAHQEIPKGIDILNIDGGKFAVCGITGDTKQIFHTFHSLYEWLHQSPYRIKQPFAFEILPQSPLTNPYENMERAIHIPVEPV
ncbi:helix-turn-helix domain-containing protein [Chryseobacterium arthrosphaerae]|uniref:Helix-turn-helix domain-containing protein n=1 Tax=Chryseobacterium arthrosphaerae TaxID=651561 RepID=A0A3S0NKU5_9FLAO|nr:helix-turn-helix domain-containing protein [Chryseobacterium arthrosphaerae]